MLSYMRRTVLTLLDVTEVAKQALERPNFQVQGLRQCGCRVAGGGNVQGRTGNNEK